MALDADTLNGLLDNLPPPPSDSTPAKQPRAPQPAAAPSLDRMVAALPPPPPRSSAPPPPTSRAVSPMAPPAPADDGLTPEGRAWAAVNLPQASAAPAPGFLSAAGSELWQGVKSTARNIGDYISPDVTDAERAAARVKDAEESAKQQAIIGDTASPFRRTALGAIGSLPQMIGGVAADFGGPAGAGLYWVAQLHPAEYRAFRDMGMDDTKADVYAHASALAQAAIFALPGTAFLKGPIGGIMRKAVSTAAEKLAAAGVTNPGAQALSKFALNLAMHGQLGTAQMLGTETASEAIKQGAANNEGIPRNADYARIFSPANIASTEATMAMLAAPHAALGAFAKSPPPPADASPMQPPAARPAPAPVAPGHDANAADLTAPATPTTSPMQAPAAQPSLDLPTGDAATAAPATSPFTAPATPTPAQDLTRTTAPAVDATAPPATAAPAIEPAAAVASPVATPAPAVEPVGEQAPAAKGGKAAALAALRQEAKDRNIVVPVGASMKTLRKLVDADKENERRQAAIAAQPAHAAAPSVAESAPTPPADVRAAGPYAAPQWARAHGFERVDESQHVPWTGGTSPDGKTLMFHAGLPDTIAVKDTNGNDVQYDPRAALAAHEGSEGRLPGAAPGEGPYHAHRGGTPEGDYIAAHNDIAVPAELAVLARDHIDPDSYDAAMAPIIAKARAEATDPARVHPDLSPRPNQDEPSNAKGDTADAVAAAPADAATMGEVAAHASPPADVVPPTPTEVAASVAATRAAVKAASDAAKAKREAKAETPASDTTGRVRGERPMLSKHNAAAILGALENNRGVPAGDRNKAWRQQAILHLTGEHVPLAKAGSNAVHAALMDALGIKRDSTAGEMAAIREALGKIVNGDRDTGTTLYVGKESPELGRTWQSQDGERKVVGEAMSDGERRLLVQTGADTRYRELMPPDRLEKEIELDAMRLREWGTAKTRAEEKAKADAEVEAKRYKPAASFLAKFNPMQAAKVRAALEQLVRYNSKETMTRGQLIEAKVKSGGTIGEQYGERALEQADETHLSQKTLGKTGMDYAAHLIAERDAAKDTPAAAPSKPAAPPRAETPASEPAKGTAASKDALNAKIRARKAAGEPQNMAAPARMEATGPQGDGSRIADPVVRAAMVAHLGRIVTQGAGKAAAEDLAVANRIVMNNGKGLALGQHHNGKITIALGTGREAIAAWHEVTHYVKMFLLSARENHEVEAVLPNEETLATGMGLYATGGDWRAFIRGTREWQDAADNYAKRTIMQRFADWARLMLVRTRAMFGANRGIDRVQEFYDKVQRGEFAKRGDAESGDHPAAQHMPTAPDFYSALTRAAGAVTQAKASAEQWVAMLTKAKGVKAEEVAWSGIVPWLKEQRGTVTKDAVLAKLRENEVNVEVHTGEAGYGKFAQYTLPGGDSNYREMRLVLPTSKRFPLDAQFHSNHFADPNVVAHLRLNDRTAPDGARVLHVEEVQSDWHQQGREKGYGTGEPENVRDDGTGWWDADSTNSEGAGGFTRAAAIAEWKKANPGVPDAPFKDSRVWGLLAMKKAIAYAVEHGYDRVTFTTGDQQAARYDLSKQVDSIDWSKHPDGSVSFGAMKNGRAIASGDKVAPSELPAQIGKDQAKHIADSSATSGSLRGDGLKVGGEGMRAFYDRILPNAVNDYVKQWGAKVGKGEIDAGSKPSREVTDALTKRIDAGDLPAGYRIKTLADGDRAVFDMHGEQQTDWRKASWALATDLLNNDATLGAQLNVHAVHSFDVTPAMREGVQQHGQPMFMPRPLTPAQRARDAAYTAAVERGDMAEAQRHVDDAAKDAGYGTKAYHGTTRGGFTAFDPTQVGTGAGANRGGFSFTTNKEAADSYARRNGGKVDNAEWYARKFNEILRQVPDDAVDSNGEPVGSREWRHRNIDEESPAELQAMVKFEADELRATHPDIASQLDALATRTPEAETAQTYSAYLNLGDAPRVIKGSRATYANDLFGVRATKDKPVVMDMGDEKVYFVADPAAIKSSDPITRDATGRVIPPSERFNAASNDVRYMAAGAGNPAARVGAPPGVRDADKPLRREVAVALGVGARHVTDNIKAMYDAMTSGRYADVFRYVDRADARTAITKGLAGKAVERIAASEADRQTLGIGAESLQREPHVIEPFADYDKHMTEPQLKAEAARMGVDLTGQPSRDWSWMVHQALLAEEKARMALPTGKAHITDEINKFKRAVAQFSGRGLKGDGMDFERRTALAAAERALRDYDRLLPAFKEYAKLSNDRLLLDRERGLTVGEVDNYASRAGAVTSSPWYDAASGGWHVPTGPSGGGKGTTAATGFTKDRAFRTLGDLYSAANPQDANGTSGYALKTMDAAKLHANRVGQSERIYQLRAYGEQLMHLADPTSKMPIATPLGANGTPAPGYVAAEIVPGHMVGVLPGFKPMVGMALGESALRQSPVMNALLKATGGLKGLILVFDSFHLARMAFRAFSTGTPVGFSKHGKRSYQRGLDIVEHDEKSFADAIAKGDVKGVTLDQWKEQRRIIDGYVDNGFNLAREAENLNREGLDSFLGVVGGLTGSKLPLVPKQFAKYVFEKYQRGAMALSAVHTYERLKATHPEMSDAEIFKQGARDLNFLFGNVGRQGIIKSRTMQDMARVVFLAPQWVESMAQFEARGAFQLGKAAATGKWNPRALPPLAFAWAAGITASLMANQIINMATRGQPTWQNQEDDHKYDAFIPDVGGKSPGFWLNPFALPSEMLYDIVKYGEQRGAAGGLVKIAENKLSPLGRAAEVLASGKNSFGETLPTTGQRVGAAAMSLAPTPIPASGFLSPHPGAVQKQAMGMVGVKAEYNPTAEQNLLAKARAFTSGKTPMAEIDPIAGRHYGPVSAALNGGSKAAVLDAVRELQRNVPEMTAERIVKYMHARAARPLTGDKQAEAKFVATLTPDERKSYTVLRAQRVRTAATAARMQAEIARALKDAP